jgi:hypothetical protein
MLTTWNQPADACRAADAGAERLPQGLLSFERRRDILILLFYGVVENLGFRQLTLWWRRRRLWDAWQGKNSREMLARVGFSKEAEVSRA